MAPQITQCISQRVKKRRKTTTVKMSSAAVQSSGAGPLSLMSCVRESSPLHDYEPENDKNVGSVRKKFWNPKSWFRKKAHKSTNEDAIIQVSKESIRSRSTSELSIPEEQTKRRSGSSMQPGLSVSHDSVFHSPNSGSDMESDAVQSSSSLSISQPQIDLRLQSELSERLRQRRGRGDTTSEDDEGLPHSPCNSPTTTDGLLDKTAIKDLPTKSHSTCSDGSLLSMGSSEMDEESFSQQSRHSSKLSLHEKQDHPDLELSSSTAPLNHSAAHHRVAVRPKRRAPHRNRVPQLSTALPTTPEVNEETSLRSVTPENVVSSKEAVSELYSSSSIITTTASASSTMLSAETQLKCSSLPPGLVLAAAHQDNSKLNRSRSNAGGSKSQDHFATLEEDIYEKEEKTKSFFERILPRKSGKKRKSKEEKVVTLSKESKSTNNLVSATATTASYSYETSSAMSFKRLESKPMAAPRSGAASRQRVQPIDLPPAPADKVDMFSGTSPLQTELENRFRQRQTNSSQSPPPHMKHFETATPAPTVISKVEHVSNSISSSSNRESRSEEIRMRIPALSPLQQRVLNLDEADISTGFKSLTDFTVNEQKPPSAVRSSAITKSHSFKSTQEKIVHVNNNQDNEEIKKVGGEESVNFSTLPLDPILPFKNSGITITGPSHQTTSIVNISNNSMSEKSNFTSETTSTVKEVTTKESQSVSITKIQVKETTQIVGKQQQQDFFTRQLKQVETNNKPSQNIVFTSPRIVDEQSRPKTLNIPPLIDTTTTTTKPRKFSQEDNIEIIEKEVSSTSPPPTARFKKNERKSSSSTTPDSPKREKPFLLASRSISLDSLKGDLESSDRSSSQDSLDKLEEKTTTTVTSPTKTSSSIVETVVLRRKSQIKQKNDEEPELMKVFARRSLKLKDPDSDSSSNQQNSIDDEKSEESVKKVESPPLVERKISREFIKLKEPEVEQQSLTHDKNEIKSPIIKESPPSPIDPNDVIIRKQNNNFYDYHRAVSVNIGKTKETTEINVVRKQNISSNRKTESWISNMKNGSNNSSGDELLIERKLEKDEIICEISPKNDLIDETNNFNQRKAEWEKRAQEATKKKTVP